MKRPNNFFNKLRASMMPTVDDPRKRFTQNLRRSLGPGVVSTAAPEKKKPKSARSGVRTGRPGRPSKPAA